MAGYTVKEMPAKAKIEYVCDECGDTDVEDRWFCTWVVETQSWVPCDHAGQEPYCNDCGEEVTISERTVL